MGIRTNEHNDSFLDFYFEGDAHGWVAVGLTKTPNMVGAYIILSKVQELYKAVQFYKSMV